MEQTTDTIAAFTGRLVQVERLAWTNAAGERVEREVVRHPGAVLIVPCLASDTLVLIRNQRIAVDAALWEFPAGTAERGELAINTARRELEEETGYRCSNIVELGSFYTSPGFTDEFMHVFLATDLTEVQQQLEAHEQIEVELRSRDEVLAMIADGTIIDGKTIAAMLLFEQHRGAISSGGSKV